MPVVSSCGSCPKAGQDAQFLCQLPMQSLLKFHTHFLGLMIALVICQKPRCSTLLTLLLAIGKILFIQVNNTKACRNFGHNSVSLQ